MYCVNDRHSSVLFIPRVQGANRFARAGSPDDGKCFCMNFRAYSYQASA